MTVFLDTGVLIGFAIEEDARHEEAVHVLADVAQGEHGAPVTSDYVLAEALNFVTGRRFGAGVAETMIAVALGAEGAPPLVRRLLRVHSGVFAPSLARYRKDFRKRLSFTDCTILALMEAERISTLATFDRGFRGLVKRMVP